MLSSAPAAALPGIEPDWAVAPQVGAFMATRAGGVSQGDFATLNLGAAVGDEPAAVAENRRRFAQRLQGARPVWLQQVHGARVIELTCETCDGEAADAAFTTHPGLACTVAVADCLPVLLAAPAGRGVAAAHAGWRGLAAGVLGNTVQALCEASACAPAELVAWLGPCIGPRAFEVGGEVLHAFGAAPNAPGAAFVSRPRPDGSARWLADLQALAQAALQHAGVQRISRLAQCTVSDPQQFFSYRRQPRTGRMAAAVWLRARAA